MKKYLDQIGFWNLCSWKPVYLLYIAETLNGKILMKKKNVKNYWKNEFKLEVESVQLVKKLSKRKTLNWSQLMDISLSENGRIDRKILLETYERHYDKKQKGKKRKLKNRKFSKAKRKRRR
jgi:hypothetical protein